MAKVRSYDHEFKVQAVKLTKEIEGNRRSQSRQGTGDSRRYHPAWLKAVRSGTLDIGDDAHTPQPAISLAEELDSLRKQ